MFANAGMRVGSVLCVPSTLNVPVCTLLIYTSILLANNPDLKWPAKIISTPAFKIELARGPHMSISAASVS